MVKMTESFVFPRILCPLFLRSLVLSVRRSWHEKESAHRPPVLCAGWNRSYSFFVPALNIIALIKMDSTSKLKEDDLAALVHEQVGKSPDAVAVIYDDNRDACCVSITYLEMWNRASAVSENLTKHGVQAETVGVCLEPCVNLPSVLLGILQTSSCFYPFGSDGQGFVQQSVQRLSVRHIILDHTSLETLQPLLLQINVQLLSCPELQSLGLCLVRIDTSSEAAGNCHLPSVQRCPGLAYCITTSGTTGTPKIVRVPHACIVPNIVDLKREFKPGVGDVTFLTSPLTFDPSMIDIFVTLTSGAALLIVPSAVKMLADGLLTMLSSRHSVTILQITPSLLGRINQRQLQDTLFGENSALRVLVIGGEPFPSRNTVLQSMSSVNSTAVYNIYGITEVSCWASLHCVRLPNGLFEDPVPIGCPLTGTKIKVVSESGEDVLCGTGEIWIGGSERVCLLDDETEDILTGDVVWRPTGDLGRVDESGRIFCLGRNDRQIKRNGKRLNLSTLQQVCCEVECVADSWATYSKGHLYLFVVGKEDAGINKEEMMVKVRSHLEQMLPSQYQPDTITAVSSMPVNRHGKLDAAVLLEMCGVGDRKSSGVIVPVEIWAQNLWQNSTGPGKTISFSDNFLTSGGDSLKAVHLAECTESHLGQKVPQLVDVILTGTYQDFLNLLRSQSEILSAADRPKRKQDFLEGGRKKQKIQATDSTPQPAETDGEVDEDGVRVERTCEINGAKMEMYHTAAENNGYLSTHAENVALDTDITDSSDGDEILKMPLTSSHSISRHFLTGNPGNADQAAPTAHRQKILPKASESNDETASGTVTADGKTVCERAMGSPSRCDDFVTSVGRGGTITHHTMEVQAVGDSTQKASSEKILPLFSKRDVLHQCKGRCTSFQGFGRKTTIKLELEWRVNTGKCVDASSLVAVTRSGKKVAFIGSHSHKFFAILMETGNVLWCTRLGGRIEGSACLSACGRLVVVGCYDHHIYMLDVHSGDVVWRVQTGNAVKCTPVTDLSSGLLLCGSHDGHLAALHCQENRVVWRQDMGGGSVFASPAVSPDGSTLHVATLAGLVHALKMSSGETVWRKDLKKPVFSSPVVDDDQVYVGCVDGGLYCLNIQTGDQKWVFWTEGPIFSSPTVTQYGETETLVLFGSHDRHLYCISSKGQLVWQKPCVSTVYASPFMFRQTALSVRCDGKVRGETDGGHDACGCCCTHTGNSEAEEMNVGSCSGGVDGPSISQRQQIVHGEDLQENVTACSAQLSKTGPSVTSPRTATQQGSEVTEGDDHTGRQKLHTMVATDHSNKEFYCSSDLKTVAFSGLVACASTNGTVFLVDVGTGVDVGSVKLPGDVFSSPVIVGDQLVVGCRDDFVYCYKLVHQTSN